MSIDWDLAVKIVVPIFMLFLGRHLEQKAGAKLIAYFVHISAFNVKSITPPVVVYTHSILIRNTGRRASNNVRINHQILPDFNIYPDTSYSIHDLPNGSKEILIPKLIPGEQITISYLYQPPTTAAQVNAGIKSDEGFAKHLNVALQRQLNKWQIGLIYFLLIIGLCFAIYMAVEFISYLIELKSFGE